MEQIQFKERNKSAFEVTIISSQAFVKAVFSFFVLRIAFSLSALVLFLATLTAHADIPLSTTTAYTQNFDGIGTAATATLPADFKVDNPATVRMVGSYSAAVTATARVGGANLAATAANGIYNFGAGTTSTGGTDRAIGFLSSGTATASGNLYAKFVNNTGADLSGLQISYSIEKYRHGMNPAGYRVQLFYSTDGATWTNAGSDFLAAFAADADNTGFNPAPGVTVAVSNKTLNVVIPSGSNLYLAWNYSVSSGTTTTNAPALAIDDISVLGVASTVPTNPSGVGAANPGTVVAGNSTLLTVSVTPGANPTSTGLTVTADLSSIGGSATQQFFDDNTNGDAVAGDNIFSFQTVVDGATSAGTKTLPATISDAQSRTGTTSISLSVSALSTPPTGTGSANPASLQSGGSTLLTVNVTPGTNPVSTGINVTGDLSSVGGSGSQQFFDDGTHGDVAPNDNVFSLQTAIVATPGSKSIPVAITDAQTRSSSTAISLTVQPPPPPNTVKISQVYGGGGNSGSTYTNDFVELFNQQSTPVDISSWSVQFNSAGATSGAWLMSPVCPPDGSGNPRTCTILPNHYFLVQEIQGVGGTTSLPAADATGTINLGATNGKVALVADTTPLNGTCPTGGSLVDLLGYGSSNCAETAASLALSNTVAAVRKNNGCVDTNNNRDDFVVVGPIPRNSAAPPNSCGGDPAQPSGIGTATPSSVLPAGNTLLTVKVTPAATPPSTGLAVSADLTSIGGSSSQPLFDDDTHGDGAADDDEFSFLTPVGALIPRGAKNIVATITDSQGRTITAPITLTVASPTCGVERWSVKTGTDPDAHLVDLTNPVPTKIADLISLPAPATPPDNMRVIPTEITEYVLYGTIILYKLEGDVDYHIVLQDDSGHTMVTEIPSPACVGLTSPFAAGVANARAKFDAHLTATTSFQSASIPVRIKGVGFFDFLHGQTGVAPNGIEIHPILDIDFTAVTTTVLSSGANPVHFGQTATITATVGNGGASTPAGRVTFLDGGNFVSSATLDQNAQAILNINTLPAGTHLFTAFYEGDDKSSPSTSAQLTLFVNPADTTTTATSSPNPSAFGQSVTFTAAVTNSSPSSTGAPTGSVQFVVDGVNFGLPVPLTGANSTSSTATSQATASLSTTVATPTHTVAANYVNVDGNYGNSAGLLAGGQDVEKAGTATTVSSSANASVFGQSVTFTATVTPVAPGAGTPAGTVVFFDNGNPISCNETGALTGGVAQCTTSGLSVGSHSITTQYDGDPNFLTSSGTLTGDPQVVSKAATSITVASSQSPSGFGQSVTFTATVSAVAPGSGTPTASVEFFDNGNAIAECGGLSGESLSGGAATCTTSALSAGNHTITTSYSGDGNFNASTGSFSGNPQRVNQASSTASLTSSANPLSYGQNVTFTATVTPQFGGVATGTVTFKDDVTTLGSGTLSGGVATFSTTQLTAAAHSVTAVYNGDTNVQGSTSPAIQQIVNPTPLAVTANDKSRLYGTANPVLDGTLTGVIDGDNITASFSTAAVLTSPVGTYAITPSLNDPDNKLGNYSVTGTNGTLTVGQASSTVIVTASQNQAILRIKATPLAVTASMQLQGSLPTGTVDFMVDGVTVASNIPLVDGIATFAIQQMTIGKHTIVASYHGDTNFSASSSAPIIVNRSPRPH